jgi:hypothetical protein
MRKQVVIAASAAALCGGAQAQSNEALKATLDQATRTIQDLQERVRALEAQQRAQQAGATPAPVAPAAAAPAPAAAPAAAAVVAPNVTAEAGTPDADKARVELYGHAMLDAIYDADRMNPNWQATLRPSQIPVVCPGDAGCGKNGSYVMSVRQSSLGMRTTIPTPLGLVKTDVAFDLFGTDGGTNIHWLRVWAPLATLLTMIEVDAKDPAFARPTKFIGPVYGKHEADRLAAEKAWIFKQDGEHWRRVVASPEPKRIFELRPIQWLLQKHTIVIAAGGGGIPAVYEDGKERQLAGIECVIDKDLATELLARELGADLLVMLTDADAVYTDWGKPTQKAIRRASAQELGVMSFAAGSMGPKVDAACRFVRATGKPAAIGALNDLSRIIAGAAGTTVRLDGDIEYVAAR